jgi:hypothetical protein
VPESASGRRSVNENAPATVAIACPLWLSTGRHCYTSRQRIQTQFFQSLRARHLSVMGPKWMLGRPIGQLSFELYNQRQKWLG